MLLHKLTQFAIEKYKEGPMRLNSMFFNGDNITRDFYGMVCTGFKFNVDEYTKSSSYKLLYGEEEVYVEYFDGPVTFGITMSQNGNIVSLSYDKEG